MFKINVFNTEEEYKGKNLSYFAVSRVIDKNKIFVEEKVDIIMTLESNPEAMIVCYYQGWAKSPYYMTKSEAEAVTDIGTAFLYDANSSVYGDYGYGDYGGYSYVKTF